MRVCVEIVVCGDRVLYICITYHISHIRVTLHVACVLCSMCCYIIMVVSFATLVASALLTYTALTQAMSIVVRRARIVGTFDHVCTAFVAARRFCICSITRVFLHMWRVPTNSYNTASEAVYDDCVAMFKALGSLGLRGPDNFQHVLENVMLIPARLHVFDRVCSISVMCDIVSYSRSRIEVVVCSLEDTLEHRTQCTCETPSILNSTLLQSHSSLSSA